MFIEISPTGVRKQKIILYTSAAQILQGEEPQQLRIQDFPEEGTNPKVGGRQPVIWPNFHEHCMKMKKIGTRAEVCVRNPPMFLYKI